MFDSYHIVATVTQAESAIIGEVPPVDTSEHLDIIVGNEDVLTMQQRRTMN